MRAPTDLMWRRCSAWIFEESDMKIALYKNTTYAYSCAFVNEVSDGENERPSEYARCSGVVDVEFPPLTEQAEVELQLASLEHSEQLVRTEFQKKLDTIKQRRAELQALTFVPTQG
jgi:hypothetical protein